VVVLEDSRELLGLTAREFVEQFLLPRLRPCAIVEGHDFHFGAGRSGNVDTLRSLGDVFGFDVHVVPPFSIAISTDQPIRVSSTLIRYMVESGHVSDAALALGHPFRLGGRIVSGRGKGREIGFPTLNMERPDQVLPAEGVYAGTVMLRGDAAGETNATLPLPAVFSIGQARTFGDTIPLLVEAHLLDSPAVPEPLCWMDMDFVAYLRSQHRYNAVEDLVAQIAADCDHARRLLAGKDVFFDVQ
jgi:riboflavin kinase/FMN adenylyltransferase